MIWNVHRKRLRILVILVAVILLGRWFINLSVEYAVTNYFHQKISPTPQTFIRYDISDINIHWLQRKVDLSSINVNIDYKEQNEDTTRFQIVIPKFSIDLLSTRDLLFRRTLNIEEISIEYPQIRVFLPLKQDTILLRKEVGDLQQETLLFLQQLNLQHFEINHASVSWSTNGIQKPRYSLNDISVRMSDIDIIPESTSGEDMTELLLTDHMEVTLHNDSLLLPDGNHRLHFKKLHISSKENLVLIDSLHLFSSLNHEIGNEYGSKNNVEIPILYLKGVDFLSLYLDNHLLIDTVLVGETDLHVMVDEQTISLFQSGQEGPKHTLDSISIKHIKLIPSFITINQASKSSSNTFRVDSAALMLDNIRHNSRKDSLFSWSVDNLELQLKNYQAKLEQLHYAFGFEKLNWSIVNKSFGLEGIRVYPIQDSLSTPNDLPLKYLEIPVLSIQDIDFKDLIFHQRLSGGVIEIASPSLGLHLLPAENNKTQAPVDISSVLQQFFKSFHLEVVNLNEGNMVLYKDQTTPFVSLENIGVNAYEWKMAEDSFTEESFKLEANVGAGKLFLPEYQVNFNNASYSKAEDYLTVQNISLRPNAASGRLRGNVELQDLLLGGILSFSENRKLALASIGSIKANLSLSDTKPTLESPKAPPASDPIMIEQLKIDQLDAGLDKIGWGKVLIRNAQADLKMLSFGQESFPLSFDLDKSTLSIGESTAQLLAGSGKIDSLSFKNNNVDMFGMLAISDSTAENEFQFNLPRLTLANIQLPDSLNDMFSIAKLTFFHPEGEAVLAYQNPSAKKADSIENKQAAVVSTNAFKVKLDTLQLVEAQWQLEQQTLEEAAFWSSTNTSFYAYHLSYPLEEPDLFSQDFRLTVSDLQHSNPDRKLNIENLSLESKNQSLHLKNSRLATVVSTANAPSLHLEATIGDILIKTDNEKGWQPEQAWTISEFMVSQPEILVTLDSTQSTTPAKSAAPSSTKLPMPSVAIKNISLNDGSFQVKNIQDNLEVALQGLDFSYADLLWKTDEQLRPEKLIQEGKWQLAMAYAQGKFAYPQNIAEIHGLQLNASPSEMRWDSLRLSPSVGPLDFSNYLTHQKSWLSVNVAEGLVAGLNWAEITKSGFHAQKVSIEKPHLKVFRDQRLPFPENHFPPLLHKMLVNMKQEVSIESIELTDGNVEVGVHPEQGDVIGRIHFSNIESIMTNVTNLPEEIQQDDVLRVKTYAQIQNAGLLKVDVDFALNHAEYPFFMDVNVGKMDLRKLNTMVEPVASVRIKRGQMRKLNIKAIGNQEFAYGNMDFMYRRLNLALLSKKDHTHQGMGLAIESFLANKLILKRNNDYPFPHRQGQLFVERDKTKSIFNYWGKIAVSGILTSAGVKSNRKALHKQYEYRRKQLESNTADTLSNTLLPE